MEIKLGCDLVNLERFRQSLARGGGLFLDKIFSPAELSANALLKSRAGIFAAKEAVIKAFKLPAGQWRSIEVIKKGNGQPEVKLAGAENFKILSQDTSISHDGEYVMAVAIFYVTN